jgi:hypothetical protein
MIGLSLHGIGQPAPQRFPGGLNRQRRAFGDLIRQLRGRFSHPAGSREHIRQTPGHRLFSGDAASRKEHQIGQLHSDQPRQRISQTEARMNPELDEVRREASLRRGDAKIGNQRQPQSPADRRALNRRHYRFLIRKKPHGMLVKIADAAGYNCRALKISASAKCLPFGRQHKSPAQRVGVQLLESVGDLANQLHIEIVIRSAMNFHQRDVPIQLNRYISHDRSLVYLRRAPYTVMTMPRMLLLLLIFTAIAAAQTPSATEEKSRAILDKALKEKNPDTRKQAVIALSLIGPRDPFAAQLESMLDDKDVEVRLATIASLVDLKNVRTSAALHRALNDDVPEVSFAAARALWSLKDPSGKESLLSILSGETKASSGFFTKQKREGLRMMHTPKTMFMFAVKTGAALAPIPGLGAGVSSMQGLLTDPGVSGRATAALLLGQDKDQQTLAALRDALTDKDWSVRAAAVHSIALRNDASLAPDILPLLEDTKEPVRLRAASGYLRLQGMKEAPRPRRKKT